jgi:arginine deiminase
MQVRSETDRLEAVLIHEPDMGIGYITPEIAEQLLYDDIVFLPRMIEEHYVFTEALRFLIGRDKVFEFQDLLEEVLEDNWIVSDLLALISKVEPVTDSTMTYLQSIGPKDLAFVLVTGLDPKTKETLLKPLPNLVFTRDLACIINDHIVISRMQKPARWRESLLMKFIVLHHPLFQCFKDKVIDMAQVEYFDPASEVALEGGDIMLVHEDYLLIGISERSSAKGVQILREQMLSRGVVKNVVTVDLPAERYCMHLDTVFTCIDKDTCVGYASLVFEPNDAVEIRCHQAGDFRVILYPSLKELMEEIFPGIQCIPCGGGLEPFASREQWTDGCNLVAVKPGVAFSYERNIHTLKALKQIEYTLTDGRHLVNEEVKSGSYLKETWKEIITIPSAELSRARGGTHCMTMPLSRNA